MNDKKMKQPYCSYGENFSGLDKKVKPATFPQSLIQTKALQHFNSTKAERSEEIVKEKFEASRGDSWSLRKQTISITKMQDEATSAAINYSEDLGKIIDEGRTLNRFRI